MLEEEFGELTAKQNKFVCVLELVRPARFIGVNLRRSMTKAEIKNEVLALFRSGVSLSYMNMRANYMYLQAAATKKLGDGSWARARHECGILTNYRLKKTKKCFTLVMDS